MCSYCTATRPRRVLSTSMSSDDNLKSKMLRSSSKCSILDEHVVKAAPLSTIHRSATCQHTSAYVGIRRHTSAYVSIRQHSSAYVSIRRHTLAYISIRQHTSAYVSIHQHTSAYDYLCMSAPPAKETSRIFLRCFYMQS